MKSKRFYSLLLLSALSINMASAELITTGSPIGKTENKTEGSIDIIENLTNKINLNPEKIENGTLGSGNQSITTSYAYLTPQRDFGYIYIKDFDALNATGTVVPAADAFGKNWNASSYSDNDYPHHRLLKIATNYMKSADFTNKLAAVNDTNYKDMYIQHDKERGQDFVAVTLYIRWLYDVGCNINHEHNGNYKKVPVLEGSNFTNGTYIATGDKMDTNPNVFSNPGNVTTIRNEHKDRIKKFSSVVKPGTNLNYPYLSSTEYNCNGTSKSIRSGALFEKRYEVRRYITEGVKDSYEVVIPTKTTTTTTKTVKPDTSPKVSIDANAHLNSSNTAIDKYTFDINVSAKSPRYTYTKPASEIYTQKINKDGSLGVNPAVNKEPADNQMDIWHSDLVPVFELVDQNGNVVNLKDKSGNTISPKPINPGKSTITIKQSDIDISLNKYTARVSLKYSSNVRYLSNRTKYDITYQSASGGSLKAGSTHKQVIEYIDEKTKDNPNKNPLKTTLETKYSETNPRIDRKYITATTKDLNTRASDTISAFIPNADNLPPDVTLEINPPNTLTILEGATFEVKLEAILKGKNPDLTATGPKDYVIKNETDIPEGEVGEHWWVDNFKIDKVDIIAKNGDEIEYDDSQITIDSSNPNKFTFNIIDVTANPQHIGVAKVKIYYSYDLNHREWRTEPSEKLKEDGTPEEWYLYTNTTTTPQKGDVEGTFTIYSLSGETVTR